MLRDGDAISMRLPISPTTGAAAQTPYQCILNTGGKKTNVKLQMFNAGITLYWTTKENDLQSVDAAGNPTRGFQLTVGGAPGGNGMYDFLAFRGKMYVACNQAIEIEIAAWDIQTGDQIV
jgi:hypothetical protein